MMYFHDENFMLPLSHDEVVHGKSPMVYKMPGDEWQKFANLRCLYTYMWTHPGARLLFMGNEFGQTSEWNHQTELDWHLLNYRFHKGLQLCIKDLNRILRAAPALFCSQFTQEGFGWIDLSHRDQCVLVYKRMGKSKEDELLVILNLTPVPRWDWEIEIKGGEFTREIFNSDSDLYGGSGTVYNPDIRKEIVNEDENISRITLNLPPLASLILR